MHSGQALTDWPPDRIALVAVGARLADVVKAGAKADLREAIERAPRQAAQQRPHIVGARGMHEGLDLCLSDDGDRIGVDSREGRPCQTMALD
jgi:hypothetical protein